MDLLKVKLCAPSIKLTYVKKIFLILYQCRLSWLTKVNVMPRKGESTMFFFPAQIKLCKWIQSGTYHSIIISFWHLKASCMYQFSRRTCPKSYKYLSKKLQRHVWSYQPYVSAVWIVLNRKSARLVHLFNNFFSAVKLEVPNWKFCFVIYNLNFVFCCKKSFRYFSLPNILLKTTIYIILEVPKETRLIWVRRRTSSASPFLCPESNLAYIYLSGYLHLSF